jgi:hypothetical protein
LRSLLLALTVFSTYAFPQQRDFQLEGIASAEASTQSSHDQQSSTGNQQQTGSQQEKTPPGVPAISRENLAEI